MVKLQIYTSDGWEDMGPCWVWNSKTEPKVQQQAEEIIAKADCVEFRIVPESW